MLALRCLLAAAACAFPALARRKIAIYPHTEMGIVRRALARWKDRRLISDEFFVRIGTRDLRVRAAEKWSKISCFPLGYGPPWCRDWYIDILFDQSHNIKFCAQSGLAQDNNTQIMMPRLPRGARQPRMQDSTRILQDLQAELEHAPLCCLLCCRCLLACLLALEPLKNRDFPAYRNGIR